MKIIADTATLLSPEEGKKLGIHIIPVSVAIGDQSYKDYIEITSEAFLDLLAKGGIPTTSQPSIGEILDALEACENEEVILLTVADGLSGGYQSAMGAKNSLENSEHIHVMNSKTLAGPLRYLAKKAANLRDHGLSVDEIKEKLNESIESSVSFVIPEDFDFLKHSGRLTPAAAKIGGILKLLPVLTQTEDKTRIMPISIKRSWKAATNAIIEKLKSKGVCEDYLISVSHAGTYEKAVTVSDQIKEAFPSVEIEILELSPALITHGGPGCIVVQAIKR